MKGTIAVVKVFHDVDADLDTLAGQTIAVLGYGIQGRAQAQNLRDSGIGVIVGNRADACREQAVRDGFATYDIADAAERGDILLLLIPDEVQADVYRRDLLPHLREGKALVFAHGFAIRCGLIDPPAGIDVLLVSPRMPGGYVRQRFVAGSGVPAFVDVHDDATGRAWSGRWRWPGRRVSHDRDRQLLSTDFGVAPSRYIRTNQQRGRAARGQSGHNTSNECPNCLDGRGHRERERPDRRSDHHGRPTPSVSLRCPRANQRTERQEGGYDDDHHYSKAIRR